MRRRSLVVEPLEGRSLLTVSTTFIGNNLVVDLNDANDTVTIAAVGTNDLDVSGTGFALTSFLNAASLQIRYLNGNQTATLNGSAALSITSFTATENAAATDQRLKFSNSTAFTFDTVDIFSAGGSNTSTGSVTFDPNAVVSTDTNSFTIGTGTLATSPAVTINANLTAGGSGDLSITSSSALFVNAALLAAGNEIRLKAPSVSDTASGSITAQFLQVDATSQIGSAANPLTTSAVAFLGATTSPSAAAAGIFIDNNSASLTIGDASRSSVEVNAATAGRGEIRLSNTGDINVTTDGKRVRAPDAVSLTSSTGAINTGGATNTGAAGAVVSQFSNVKLDAKTNILVGQTALGDVVAGATGGTTGALTLLAGGAITVNSGAQVAILNGTGAATLTAGTNINVGNGAVGKVTTKDGKITFTTGANGTFHAQGSINSVNTTGNDISIFADTLDLAAGATIDAGTNGLVVFAPVTSGDEISLGAAGADLTVLQSDLDKINSAKLVQIGRSTGTGNIVLRDDVTDTSTTFNSTLALITGGVGTITQLAAKNPNVTKLFVQTATGDVTLLDAANTFQTVAGVGAGGKIQLRSTSALTVDAVNGGSGIDTTTGGNTTGADVLLYSGAALSVNQSIKGGTTGTVRLQSSTDAVTQTATGSIIAAALGVVALKDIDLTAAAGTNDVATFAADNSGSAGANIVKFAQTTATTNVSVDEVAANAPFTVATGIKTKGDVIVVSAGKLTVNKPIDATGNTVRLQSTGSDVVETATGSVVAANLGVAAKGKIDFTLGAAANLVATFAADNSGGTAADFVKYVQTTAGNLTVKNVTASAPFSVNAIGIKTNGDVTVVANGNLTINQPIDASAGSVRLKATGTVSQDTTGEIAAINLGVLATDDINLTASTTNHVSGAFRAENTVAGKVVQYADSGSLVVGTFLPDSDGFVTFTAPGIKTNDGDVTVTANGTLQVNQPILITAGAGTDVVRLLAAGDLTQTAAITAKQLGVRVTAGKIDLTANNAIGTTFAAENQAANQTMSFTNVTGQPLSIGTVANVPNFGGAATNVVGISTNGAVMLTHDDALTVDQVIQSGPAGGDVELQADSITLDKDILDTGKTVKLTATAGDISQTGGKIVAASLGAKAAIGSITLGQAANSVTTFAASANGNVTFKNASDLTIGTVAPAGTGITGATVTLTTAAGKDLDFAANASATKVLVDAGGDVTQSAGKITGTAATALSVKSGGNIDLDGFNNDVDVFAADAAGTLTFKSSKSLQIGAVGGGLSGVKAVGDTFIIGLSDVSTASLVQVTNGDFNLQSGGTLTLQAAVNVTGVAKTARLVAADTLSQAAAGKITVANLSARSSGSDVNLDLLNAVSNEFAAAAATSVTFRNASTLLTIGNVPGTGNATYSATFTVLAGVVANSGDATVRQTGDLTIADSVEADGAGDVNLKATGVLKLASNVTAGGDTVRLVGNQQINQTGGVITAMELSVATSAATGTVNLPSTNLISDTFAGTSFGSTTFKNSSTSLAIGTVGGIGDFGNQIGLTTGGDAVVMQTGSLVVKDDVKANANGNVTLIASQQLTLENDITAVNTVRLEAAQGIAQTGGIITAKNLSVKTTATTGDVDLPQANKVSVAFAGSSFGSTNFQNASASLSIGTVGALNGLTTGGNATVAQTGLLSVDKAVASNGSGGVKLSSGGALNVNAPVSASNTGDVELTSTANKLTLKAAVSAIGDVVRLQANTGIEEASAAGKVFAEQLSAKVDGAGAVSLKSDNVVTGTFAANTPVGAIAIKNTDAAHQLALGTVDAVVGIKTGNGDISILNTSNSLRIQQQVEAAAAGNVVRLEAKGNVTQELAGTISAAKLAVRSKTGLINLATDSSNAFVSNSVQEFAAVAEAAGKSVKFNNAAAFAVTSITGDTLVAGPINGVKTKPTLVAASSGDITLRSAAGGITLKQVVQTGDALNNSGNAVSGNIRLNAAGDLQTVGGKVITGNVSTVPGRVGTVGTIGLRAQNVSGSNAGAFLINVGAATGASAAAFSTGSNRPGKLAVFANGSVKIANLSTSVLRIGDAAADAPLFNALDGIVAAGDVTVSTQGSLIVSNKIQAPNKTVSLNFASSAANQESQKVFTLQDGPTPADSLITAAQLNVTSSVAASYFNLNRVDTNTILAAKNKSATVNVGLPNGSTQDLLTKALPITDRSALDRIRAPLTINLAAGTNRIILGDRAGVANDRKVTLTNLPAAADHVKGTVQGFSSGLITYDYAVDAMTETQLRLFPKIASSKPAAHTEVTYQVPAFAYAANAQLKTLRVQLGATSKTLQEVCYTIDGSASNQNNTIVVTPFYETADKPSRAVVTAPKPGYQVPYYDVGVQTAMTPYSEDRPAYEVSNAVSLLTIYGNAKSDWLENRTGSLTVTSVPSLISGNDRAGTGGAGDDTIIGGTNTDVLFGGSTHPSRLISNYLLADWMYQRTQFIQGGSPTDSKTKSLIDMTKNPVYQDLTKLEQDFLLPDTLLTNLYSRGRVAVTNINPTVAGGTTRHLIGGQGGIPGYFLITQAVNNYNSAYFPNPNGLNPSNNAVFSVFDWLKRRTTLSEKNRNDYIDAAFNYIKDQCLESVQKFVPVPVKTVKLKNF